MSLPHAYFFDADGVLTSKDAKPNKPVIEMVANLGTRAVTTIITGRPARWLQRCILPTMSGPYRRHQPLSPVVAYAEYGAVQLTRQANRQFSEEILGTPLDALRDQVTAFIRDLGNTSIVMDTDKHVIVTAVATFAQNPKLSYVKEHVDDGLNRVGAFMQQLAAESNGNVTYEKSLYARDLVPKEFGKGPAVAQALVTYAETFGGLPPKVSVFGDSLTDYDMTEPLRQLNIPYTFYFVGDPEIILHLNDRHIDITSKRHDLGTLEVIRILG
jgi:hydroxymethylpyrimidine pyrophosphatase-like HAD family hydrolase